MVKTGKQNIIGDQDPMDILVLEEKNIENGGILVQAIPIGGFRMIDKNEADDKIIAVLSKDEVFTQWKSIEDCPETIITRLKHYFLTYKNMPGEEVKQCEITHVYSKDEAQQIIKAALLDYEKEILPKL